MNAQVCLADSNMIMTRIPDEGLWADDGACSVGLYLVRENFMVMPKS